MALLPFPLKIAAMHLFLAERKKTLSHVFISPQDILQSSGADDYLVGFFFFFLCMRVCACVWVAAWL